MRNLAARAAMLAKSNVAKPLYTGFSITGSQFYEQNGYLYTSSTNLYSSSTNSMNGSYDFSTYDNFELVIAAEQLYDIINNSGASLIAFQKNYDTRLVVSFEYVSNQQRYSFSAKDSNGTSIFSNYLYSEYPTKNTKFYLKCAYNSVDGYSFLISYDGSTWETLYVCSSTTKISSSMTLMQFGGIRFSSTVFGNSFLGRFYESECSFTANGTLLWKGA